MTPALAFLRDETPLPPAAVHHARRFLLDLLGTGWGGSRTALAAIVAAHAREDLPGAVPIPFGRGTASPMGAALAAGMTIDALDGHDGCNLTKGHAGCGLLAGLLAVAPDAMAADALLDLLARGYEIGTRMGIALHATAGDYHTSGAWIAPTVAGLAARVAGLDAAATAHAMGIAEYHGPRSPMMRVIDHPTMLKDGSGMGAMVGVQAAQLAARGFTGAPAALLGHPAFDDLGARWFVAEQYLKPYPVCRWAQAPVEAALALRAAHGIDGAEVETVRVESFHEATRLATRDCRTTEEAQYSTAFPVAVALARGAVGPRDVTEGLDDPLVRRIAARLDFAEDAAANAAFPETRLARVTVRTARGAWTSDWHRPRWDADAPPSDADLVAKMRATVAGTPGDADAIERGVLGGGARTVAAIRALARP